MSTWNIHLVYSNIANIPPKKQHTKPKTIREWLKDSFAIVSHRALAATKTSKDIHVNRCFIVNDFLWNKFGHMMLLNEISSFFFYTEKNFIFDFYKYFFFFIRSLDLLFNANFQKFYVVNYSWIRKASQSKKPFLWHFIQFLYVYYHVDVKVKVLSIFLFNLKTN